MPPSLPHAARQLIPKQISRAVEGYVCPSCSRKASRSQQRAYREPSIQQRHEQPKFLQRTKTRQLRDRPEHLHIRRASTNGSVASRTAIIAPTTVPQRYRELYQRLLVLQEAASSYVDLSRLQLALRSLESSTPVVRVALLGLGSDGSLAARKLARALLSDPLSDEQDWENKIVDGVSDGRSLLIKYGEAEEDEMGRTGQTTLLQTLQIPSPFLKQNSIEVLITNLIGDEQLPFQDDQGVLQDAILVPTLTTPTSTGSSVSFVRYPVHKALIVTEGILGAVQFGRLSLMMKANDLVGVALSVPLRKAEGAQTAEQETTSDSIDIDLALHSLELFRSSRANGARFSDEWQTSRVSRIADWITGAKTENSVAPDVQKLVSSVLSRSVASLAAAEESAKSLATASSVPDEKRRVLQSAISAWAAQGHKDLQSNLDPALADSSAWRRTVWWRLFWRIDDVTLSTGDLLRQHWLNEADQRLAFLSGQIVEAGLATGDALRGVGSVQLLDPILQEKMDEFDKKPATEMTVAQLVRMPSMLAAMQQQSGLNALFSPPWPQTITWSRQYLITTAVPALHARAQALLFTSVSTLAGSTALAAWLYVATAGIALYESGAIVALGFVWALRRLQKKWSRDRLLFAESAREDGRKVLAEVEESLRKIVKEGGRVNVRAEDGAAWREARIAVERCQEALDAVGSKK